MDPTAPRSEVRCRRWRTGYCCTDEDRDPWAYGVLPVEFTLRVSTVLSHLGSFHLRRNWPSPFLPTIQCLSQQWPSRLPFGVEPPAGGGHPRECHNANDNGWGG